MPERGPRLRQIRRFGTPLPGLTRKSPRDGANPPGMHGPSPRRRRRSGYAVQLEEKQKVRLNYGLTESQLRHYFRRALREPGVTGEILLTMIERRLDNVVFRLGFAPTIPAARQLVSHGHVYVDGRRVDRAGYEVKVGQTIALAPRTREVPDVAASIERGPQLRLPGWLALDPSDRAAGRVVAPPTRGDVPILVDDAAIVEFYAR
jgi:small subunit ribosomal protein S4